MKYKNLFAVLVSITCQYDIIKESDQSVRKSKIYWTSEDTGSVSSIMLPIFFTYKYFHKHTTMRPKLV